MPKLSVTNLTKIFGSDVETALALVDQGLSKEDIYKRTKTTVGVNQVSFSVEEGEPVVIMSFLVVGSRH